MARSPAESIGWQLSGSPIGRIRLAASNSRMPARTPNSTRLIASDDVRCGKLELRELVDLVDRSQPRARSHENLGRVDDLPGGSDAGPDRIDDERGDFDPRFRRRSLVSAKILPAHDSDFCAAGDAGVVQQVRKRRRAAALLTEQPEWRIELHLDVDRRALCAFPGSPARSGSPDRAPARPPSALPRSADRSRSDRRDWRNARGRHRRRRLSGRRRADAGGEAVEALGIDRSSAVPGASRGRRNPEARPRSGGRLDVTGTMASPLLPAAILPTALDVDGATPPIRKSAARLRYRRSVYQSDFSSGPGWPNQRV